jgi:hypothetical protein
MASAIGKADNPPSRGGSIRRNGEFFLGGDMGTGKWSRSNFGSQR